MRGIFFLALGGGHPSRTKTIKNVIVKYIFFMELLWENSENITGTPAMSTPRSCSRTGTFCRKASLLTEYEMPQDLLRESESQ